MDRREFLKTSGLGALALVLSSCGFSKQTASSAGVSGSGSPASPKEKVAGTGGDTYIPPEKRQGNESVVYFTRDLSAAGLLKIYETIAGNMTGKVGIKLHTGEPHGPNIIPRPWVKQLMEAKLPNARIVETNTYYGGARYTTEEHRKTLAVNGWDFAPVDILDEEGTTMLPVKGGKWFTEMSVGSHLLNYDSLLVLTHFKGHTMGGFGGSDKKHRHRLCRRPHRQEDDPLRRRRRPVGHRQGRIHGTADGIIQSHSGPFRQPHRLPEKDRHALVERMESRHGLRQLSYMKEMGMGCDRYVLLDLDHGSQSLTLADAVKDVKPFEG